MAKKRTRKSRKARRTTPRSAQPQVSKQPAAAEATQQETVPTSSTARRAADFAREYAYVYFDLRKMFTVAAVMFVLLILTNIVLTRLVVL